MVFIIDSHTVCKMGALRKPQFFQFLIHPSHKCFMRARRINRQPHCRFRAGRKYGAIKQVAHGHGFLPLKPGIAASVHITIIRHIISNLDPIIQVINMLGSHQERQHLCHRCRIHSDIGIFFCQNALFFPIDKHRISAGDISSQLEGVLCLFCKIFRPFLFLLPLQSRFSRFLLPRKSRFPCFRPRDILFNAAWHIFLSLLFRLQNSLLRPGFFL